MDDFIEQWPMKVHPALVEALEYLARHDVLPAPDGVVGRWVDTLCALSFEASDAPHIAALLDKTDPHLVEVGVRLAHALLGDVDAWAELEAPLVRAIDRGPLDAWVARALAGLLRFTGAPPSVYRALVKRHGESAASASGIMRNMHIRPWEELEEIYAQLLIQELEPGDRERAVLPVLEKKFGTRGFKDTQDRIIRDLGYEPAEHRALLARRP